MLWAQITQQIDEYIRNEFGKEINPTIAHLKVSFTDTKLKIVTAEDKVNSNGFRRVELVIIGE